MQSVKYSLLGDSEYSASREFSTVYRVTVNSKYAGRLVQSTG